MLDWQRAWPQGSFKVPVPIPSAAPGDGPLLCLAVNEEWMQYLIGAAKQLMLPSTWGDASDPLVQGAQRAANDLIAILAEATACGADDVAGTYTSACLAAPVSTPINTPVDVLSLTVQPGEYDLDGIVTVAAAAADIEVTLWDDAGTKLAEEEAVPPGSSYSWPVPISAHVTPTVATTYTVRIESPSGTVQALADPNFNSTGAHLATCLHAYPLGVSGPAGPIGPPGGPASFRFTADCIMQYSTDSGVTWLDVPGWDANAPTCFAGFHGAAIPIDDIDPGAPPNVQDVPAEQAACNIAAYLAQTVIRGAVNEAQRQATLTNDALDFGVALVALIPGIDLVMVGLAAGANALYQLVDGDNLSDFTAAASDEALWSAVTCAIYGVIAEDGEVTDANFAAVGAAIGGVTYSHAEVPTAMAIFWGGLGVKAVRAAQIAGALEVADCSACATSGAWCTWWQSGERDMCNGEWTAVQASGGPAGVGTCAGDVFTPASGGGSWGLKVQIDLPHPRTITTVRNDWSGSFGDIPTVVLYDAAGTALLTRHTGNWRASDGDGPIANVARITVENEGGDSPANLTSLKVGGPDFGSPWLENNGVCD